MTYIPFEDSVLEVELNPILGKPEKYFVEISKNKERIASFDMKQDRFENWTVIEPAPQWVGKITGDLNIAIRNKRKLL